MMFDALLEVSEKLVTVIQREATTNNGQLEVGDILSRFVTDVIGSTDRNSTKWL